MKTSYPLALVLIALSMLCFSGFTPADTLPGDTSPLPCQIAFESDRDGNREVYVMEPDGSNLTNLTNNPADDMQPAWSPDGSRITFVSDRENEGEGGQFIYVMDADGGNVRQLNNENESQWPDWSPDGKRIIYDHLGDIYVISADGGQKSKNLTGSPENDVQPKWSPDGNNILWLSGEEGKKDIHVMDADGHNKSRVTKDAGVHDAVWSVDGRIIGHWDGKEAGCFNCLINADGSNTVDAGGKGTIQNYVPFWTADGQLVEINSGDHLNGNNEIFLASSIFPDMFLNLTNNKANDINPDWPKNCGNTTKTPADNKSLENDGVLETNTNSSPDIILGYEGDPNSISDLHMNDLRKACNELKIKCVQGEDISKLVDQNVDAIISYSNRWHVLGSFPAFLSAVEKGIPVIVLNAETSVQGAYNLSIESAAMRGGLKWMLDGMNGKGEFVYFNVGKNDWHQSIIDEVLKDYPGITAISVPADYEGNRITEKKIMDLAKSKPNLGAIWADENLQDVFWGIKNGEIEPIPAMLCTPRQDAWQFWRDWINDGTGIRCYSIVKPGGTAYEGVYVAYYLLTGEEIAPSALGGNFNNTFLYDFPVITNEDLDEWLGRTDEFRIGDGDTMELPPMTPEEIKEKWFVK